jgi:hypothetical protein
MAEKDFDKVIFRMHVKTVLRTKINLCLKWNTVCFHYRDQSLNVAQENDHSCWKNHTIHINTLDKNNTCLMLQRAEHTLTSELQRGHQL